MEEGYSQEGEMTRNTVKNLSRDTADKIQLYGERRANNVQDGPKRWSRRGS